MNGAQDLVRSAAYTAVSELGESTPYEDLLDSICGQLPAGGEFLSGWEGFALHCLKQLGVDISDACETHERPMDFSEKCDGTCQARSRL